MFAQQGFILRTSILGCLLLFLFIFSLNFGEKELNLYYLLFQKSDDLKWQLFVDLRLSRTLLALLVGIFLSSSGLVYQSVFQNNLVSPDILGASAGAVLGIIIGYLLGINYYLLPILAFIFGIFSVLITFLISSIILKDVKNNIIVLIIVGLVFTSFLTSLVGGLYYFIPENDMYRGISFFLKGALNGANYRDVAILMIFGAPSLLLLFFLQKYITIFSLPYEVIYSQGFPIRKLVFILLFLSTMCYVSTVSVAGIVGWVSLIIPNILRITRGENDRELFVPSALLGASFIIFSDMISRGTFEVELPLGLVTGILGIPIFLLVLTRLIRK